MGYFFQNSVFFCWGTKLLNISIYLCNYYYKKTLIFAIFKIRNSLGRGFLLIKKYAMKKEEYTFNLLGINYKLVDNINSKEITTPTPIQKRAIPIILQEKNMVGVARTGTGKTLAFLLPIFDKWLQDKEKKFLILCPSKELAFQIQHQVDLFGKEIGITHALVSGGIKEKSIRNIEKKSPDIIIANPRTLKQLHVKNRLSFSNLNAVVLDEVDQMMEKSMEEDMNYLFTHIPNKVQKLFFSATVPKKLKSKLEEFASNLEWIEIQKHISNKLNIEEKVYYSAEDDKLELLFHLLYENLNKKTIVFFNDRNFAKECHLAIKKADFKTEFIHGKKEGNTRINFINNFRDNKYNILITTDVLGRGIDITDVELIINLEVPDTKELYEHRIGRTGRLGRKGMAITCCCVKELRNFRQIEQLHKEPIKEVYSHPFYKQMPAHVEKTKLKNKGMDGSNAHRKAWNNLLKGKN
jgi:ATP-dependent RNA helicase RhlE